MESVARSARLVLLGEPGRRHRGVRQQRKPAMAVLMVDNPPGQNAGYYRVLPLDTDPERDGAMAPATVSLRRPGRACGPAARSGKVMFFAGSGSSATRFDAADFGRWRRVFTSVVWDPTAAPPGNFFHPATLFAPNHRPFDFFCGGDTLLADGRLLSAGGTGHYNPFLGRNDACVFDPVTEQWTFVKSMAHGRWYPTLITLGDGRVLAATGLTEALGNPHNKTIEIYDPAARLAGETLPRRLSRLAALCAFVPDGRRAHLLRRRPHG